MDSPEKSSNLCILTSNPKIIVALMQLEYIPIDMMCQNGNADRHLSA